MTEELYDTQETRIALEALGALSAALPEPFVVLGGWAVYLTVLESYRREHGAPYLGSRDVDVGFHVDPAMSVDALRTSTFSKAIEIVRGLGYVPIGSFRYCKFIHKGTGEVLTEEQAKSVSMIDLFYVYVDMMVDRIHPQHDRVFKVKALDEPVLGRVFDERCGVSARLGDVSVVMPPPHLLLASKLRSIPGRQKDDKVLKDACDIYAVIWHSPVSYDRILSTVHKEYPQECATGLAAITDVIAERAARHLGVETEAYLGVVRKLKTG